MTNAPLLPAGDPDVLPALRELFSQRPGTVNSGPETLCVLLYALRYLPYRPEEPAVEAALEVPDVERLGGAA